MKKEDILRYIGYLLQEPNPEPEIISEIPNVSLAIVSYMAGLQGKSFPIGNLMIEVDIEKEIPVQYYTIVAQCAILKSKKGSNKAIEYIRRNIEKYLEYFKYYFIKA